HAHHLADGRRRRARPDPRRRPAGDLARRRHDPRRGRSRTQSAGRDRVFVPARHPHAGRRERLRDLSRARAPERHDRLGHGRARHGRLRHRCLRRGAVALALGTDAHLRRLRLVSHRARTVHAGTGRLFAMTPNTKPYDVVVVGGGNAALCAALAAHSGGASVVVLDKAPEPERGGNSFFTAGGFRFAHHGLDDLRKDVIPDLSDSEARSVTIDPYTEDAFYDDIMRVTENRSDPDLAQHLVWQSKPTVMW